MCAAVRNRPSPLDCQTSVPQLVSQSGSCVTLVVSVCYCPIETDGVHYSAEFVRSFKLGRLLDNPGLCCESRCNG